MRRTPITRIQYQTSCALAALSLFAGGCGGGGGGDTTDSGSDQAVGGTQATTSVCESAAYKTAIGTRHGKFSELASASTREQCTWTMTIRLVGSPMVNAPGCQLSGYVTAVPDSPGGSASDRTISQYVCWQANDVSYDVLPGSLLSIAAQGAPITNPVSITMVSNVRNPGINQEGAQILYPAEAAVATIATLMGDGSLVLDGVSMPKELIP